MPDAGKALVFVVDDEPNIAQTAARILRNDGFDARDFTEPIAALQAARLEAPDLLLTDVIMPGLNGFELSSWVSASCPQCKVILFSGDPNARAKYATSHDQKQFDILTKPVAPDNLLNAIRRKLDS